ncbi:MAG: PepSY domain-containing protein [Gemmatimonadota bacterium]|nr:PepSY domain-containing protein [Gemmatimonadota bacterium]
MSTKDLVLKLHRWGGLATGLVAFLLSLTGAVLLITMPADTARAGQIGRANTGAPLLPPSAILAAARATMPDVRPRSLEIRFVDTRRAEVQFSENTIASIDPWDGSVIEVRPESDSLSGDWIHFHSNLMLGAIGKSVVGISTIVFVLLAALGLWLWWPNRRTVRRAFLIQLRRGFKRANYDIHNVLGFYSALLLLILGLTGVLLAYPGLQGTTASILGRVMPEGSPPAAPPAAEASRTATDSPPAGPDATMDDTPAIDRAWAAARGLYPDAPWQRAFLVGTPTRFRVQVGAGDPGDLHRHHLIQLDAEGRLVRVTPADRIPLRTRLPVLVGRIHTGDMGGAYRVAAFLACLVGVTLPVTGFLVWFPRWRRRRRAGTAET